uniref:Uncharacterized protein n=1 Tax=Avena sativa TaxID=4498 RepID=A0ACD5Y9C7_AVESA
MAPASASLLPAASSSAKRPAPAAAAEHPLAQDGVAAPKNSQSQQQQQQQLECPRCQSTNTKFCYYNNYSTAQPRHFCRACRRYWTHGGTLRKVPVGGACRRAGNKGRKSAEPSPSSSSPSAEDAAYQTDMLPVPATPPFFPFLSDGAVFLPQFDLGLGRTGFPWPAPAGPDLYDGLATPWSGSGDGTLAGAAWDDFAAGLDLTWPSPPPPPSSN